MVLYIKQHIFTWGDTFSIYDVEGREQYMVKGEVFTLGKKLHLYDLANRELAFIQQRLLTFLPRYEIMRNGTQIAEIVKEFTFFRHEYTVNGLGWKVHGDVFSHDYEITDGSRRIAAVQKEWFTLGDAYQITIEHGVDEIAALAVVLVIDACIEASKNNN
ncbi:MAG: LURP-one-related family protein [Oscillospiraceae bacterium]|nr:LURP-one-related family protein [Oscillospiraceae bacterium]